MNEVIDIGRGLEERTRSLSRSVLGRWADDVDRENRFPAESIQSVADAGLLGLLVPADLGGCGGSVQSYCAIASLLAEECLSTALIWVMHSQQVAVLADHALGSHADVLSDVAANGALIASVTTEPRRGSSLLSVSAPLVTQGDRVLLQRSAPTVSYGAESQYFLVTMRAGEDRPESDVRLALAARSDGDIRVTGDWHSMGVRGTRTIPMRFDVTLAPERVVGGAFRPIALKTMVPFGHLGWTAAWLGAARGAFRRVVAETTTGSRAARRMWDSDLFVSRLAELRMSLDLVDALLLKTTARFVELRSAGAELLQYEDASFNIALNNLKIAGSRLCFSIADGLVELCGLSDGYLKHRPAAVERVFRDLRSAPLMYSNDQLIAINGRLVMFEHRSNRERESDVRITNTPTSESVKTRT